MHIEKTKLKGLIILRSEVHKDNRGFFKELFLKILTWFENGLPV